MGLSNKASQKLCSVDWHLNGFIADTYLFKLSVIITESLTCHLANARLCYFNFYNGLPELQIKLPNFWVILTLVFTVSMVVSLSTIVLNGQYRDWHENLWLPRLLHHKHILRKLAAMYCTNIKLNKIRIA